MKQLLLLGALTALPVTALAAPAVNFHGEVATQTCQVTVNGETDPIVQLPSVAVADFNGAGSTAGQTPYTISVTGCPARPLGSTLKLTFHYLGHNVTSRGNLGNTAANGATDVAVQLTLSGGRSPVVLDGLKRILTVVMGVGDEMDYTLNYEFGARYITEGGNPTSGPVTAVAEYVISYL